MGEQLDAYGRYIQVGRVRLRTPGLAGEATPHLPGSSGMRGAELATESLERALQEEHVEPVETIEISRTREIPAPAVRTRSTAYDEPAIEAQVPGPGEEWGQVVLFTDEAGVTTWHLAVDEDDRVVTRGPGTRTYVIPRRVSPPPAAGAPTRGLIGAIGKKLLKVLVFPLTDPVVGAVAEFFAGRWEANKRRYLMRSVTPENYTGLQADEVASREDWDRLSEGRVLMMIHGTFCLTHTSFGTLLRPAVESLSGMYGGRMVGFDHFTISEDPRRNVERLLTMIPDGTSLEMDVITSSRGALVARTLAEKQSEFSLGSRSLRIRRVIFQAGPNAGTPLADDEHMGRFIDSYTNVLNFFPELVGVSDILQGIVTVVKQLAVASLKGLGGLQCMSPRSDYLSWLNRGPRGETRYFALASDFEPKDFGLATFKDAVIDAVFQKAENDLVVPTAGVYGENGSEYFPIEDRLLLAPEEGVAHGGYFSNGKVQEQLLSWLGS